MSLIEIKHNNYEINYDNLKITHNHLASIQDISLNNNLYFSLIGHFSLVLLSNQIYRNPEDLDILVKKEDVKKWIHLLSKEWGLLDPGETVEALRLFYTGHYKKFASIDINNCSILEKDADIYFINNGKFTLLKQSTSNNYFTPWYDQPKFVYHDPNPEQKKNDDKPFIEIKNDLFKIWFFSSGVTKYFKAFVVFYDENLKHKEVIECNFEYDVKQYHRKLPYPFQLGPNSYWSSDFLNIKKYDKCYYRIFLYKNMFSLRLENLISKFKIECYINDDISDTYKVPIKYTSGNQVNNYIKSTYNSKPINLTNPFYALKHKFGRQKDTDDKLIYKYLLDQYPVDK